MAAAVVFLHGFSNTGASWDPVIAALPQRYRALAPDLRGHGSAAGAQPVALDGVIADLAATAPQRFTLVGYSMGGRLALHTALAIPERVARLVLIGASPGLADPDARRARRRADEALADELQGLTIEAFAARWAQTPVLAGAPADVVARAQRDRLRNTPEGLARALRGLGTGALAPLWDRLGELGMAVELVAGERDEKFSALAREMATGIGHARVTIIPGAGHAAHLEAPGAVAALIASGAPGVVAAGPSAG
ncbi:MAG: 2-succinyl-6-hydroxy-2,4-cyclohexadiene-carboxylate synthase [Solirubrobacteraceae bacterium]|jgi:2-succinyl-6-hydroxy-2,4-cyclohexadiene-1-carboxylate synthase|nr:2-succinyl-6-hydroxy-2,4-cyclohexadiene-carboxylate synthase [Solirubrobacteraceae bacterium]